MSRIASQWKCSCLCNLLIDLILIDFNMKVGFFWVPMSAYIKYLHLRKYFSFSVYFAKNNEQQTQVFTLTLIFLLVRLFVWIQGK